MAELPDIPGYRLLKVLKQSKRSRTFLAEQTSLARQVALKVMSEEFFNEPILRQRFVDEGKSAARLNHPNVLAVFDIGSAGGYPFIATEFVPGGTLRDTLQQPMAPMDALRIAKELASALEYAHSQGVVHRDIKPSNILFRSDGAAVLSDLGILKAQSVSVSMQMGSPHYMSPEQIEGQIGDGRADLYSLGVVLYEMLTGRPPFDADDPFVVVGKHLSEPVPRLPESLSIYQPLIDRTLAKTPEGRYLSAKEMVVALDGYLEPKTVREVRAPEPQKAPPPTVVSSTADAPATTALPRPKPGRAAAAATAPMPEVSTPRAPEPMQPSGPPTMQQPVITAPLPASQRNLAARQTPAPRATPKNNPMRALKRVGIVLAVLALLAFGAWKMLSGPAKDAPVPEPPRKQIAATTGGMEADFQRAERLMRDRKYFEPKGDNALELYRQLEKLPGGADRARAGIRELGASIAKMVVEKRAANDLLGANATLLQALTYLPDDPSLLDLQKKLNTPR